MHPEDAYKQLRFLQELNKNYPALVVRRVEENRFATDEAVQKEYIKALVRCAARCCIIRSALLKNGPSTGPTAWTRSTSRS